MTYAIITKESFSNRYWSAPSDYRFALEDTLMPLLISELSKAALSIPFGFIKQAEKWSIVGLAGFQLGRNHFITQAGEWVGRYIPAHYRAYPFSIALSEGGEELLCVHEDSPCLSENPEDTPFFDAQGNPSEALQGVMRFLYQCQRDEEKTQRALESLAVHGLFAPWEIKVQDDTQEISFTRLCRFDEEALHRLAPEALSEITQNGGIMLGCCQLLSMQHLQELGSLVAMVRQRESRRDSLLNSQGDLDLEFLNQDSTISFGGL